MRQHIQGLSRLKTLGFLLFAVTALCWSSEAQLYRIGASVSTTATTTNTPVRYRIAITNLDSSLPITDIRITNTFNSSISYGITNTYTSTNFTTSSNLVIQFNSVLYGTPAEISITVTSAVPVSLTNMMKISFGYPAVLFSTNFVTSITNTPTDADLAVSIDGPSFPVLANDYLTYKVNITNLGPNIANNVFLTNTLPSGVIFRNASSSNNSVISIGTLSNLAVRAFQISVQPTNSGTNLTFSAAVATSNSDTNTANNFFSTNITVLDFATNGLIVTNLSAMTLNPQNALMEQSVRLVNAGTNTVDSARVIVTGITNWLRNAVGTNAGNPYVIYGAALDAGQSVDLLLQYFVPTRLPITVSNSQYIAVATPAVSFAAPTNYTFAITNIFTLPSGAVVLEFGAAPGRTYTILYSSDFSTNTLAAQPSIVAQSSKVQWIDDGPPKTISHPSDTNSPVRFYRVLLNP